MTDPGGPVQPITFSVRRELQGGFIAHWASWLLRNWRTNGRPNYLHPGDPFGRVLAYLRTSLWAGNAEGAWSAASCAIATA